VGIYKGLDEIAALWARERAFEPAMPAEKRDAQYRGWMDAVGRVRSK